MFDYKKKKTLTKFMKKKIGVLTQRGNVCEMFTTETPHHVMYV